MTQADTAPPPWHRRLLGGIIIVVALIGAVFIALDWEEFRKVLSEADWRMIVPGLAFSAISYFCVGYSYAIVAKLLEIHMGWRDLTEIGFVTVLLNHIITMGGVAGFSVRYLLMERHGIRMRAILSSSFLHFYLSSVVIIAILPVCFIYLLDNATLPKSAALLIGIATLVVILISIIGALLLLVNRIRTQALNIIGKVANLITRQDIRTRFNQFNDTMNQSAAITRSNPLSVLAILVVAIIGWSAAIITMGFCFDALGTVPAPGVLITGFVIGLVAGVLSMVPGGFGVQEASMAGIYALLGVPFELALLSAILFRGVYYLVPYVVSFIFYGRLLRKEPLAKDEGRRREDSTTIYSRET